MAINFNNIVNEFIRIARDEVGSQLSTLKKQGALVPAVFQSRDMPPTPSYPYITVDVIVVNDSGSWLIHEGLNIDEEPYFASYYKVVLQYTVFGDNSLGIAHELKGKFRIGRVLDEVKTNTTGVVEDVFGVTSLPQKLSTAFVEVASFNLDFGITDTVVDTQSGVIETVNTSGAIVANEGEASEDSLDFTISVTETTTTVTNP